MELPRIILVASDFSENSQHAVDYATQLAKRLDARLYLIHCWKLPTPGASVEMAWVATQEMLNQLEAAARGALEAAASKVQSTLPNAEAQLVQSDPRDGIVRTASELKADLIVVGTQGRRGLPRLLLGSVAEYIVRHAPCPVLTVRAPQQSKAETNV